MLGHFWCLDISGVWTFLFSRLHPLILVFHKKFLSSNRIKISDDAPSALFKIMLSFFHTNNPFLVAVDKELYFQALDIL